MFTIIHNSQDETSRNFITNNPDYSVVDWFNETSKNNWLQSTNFNNISAFPTVVWKRNDLYNINIGENIRTIEPGYEAVRLPESMNDVFKEKANIDALVAVTKFEKNKITETEARQIVNISNTYNNNVIKLENRIDSHKQSLEDN